MKIVEGMKKAVKKMSGRPGPRLLTVKEAFHLTPNMIRVVFAGPELTDFPEGKEGANCKLMLPEPDETRETFEARLGSGPSPVRRTYTVRSFDAETSQMVIDFVDHGDSGPASAWARRATPGAFLGFAGPGPVKVTHFDADWYLVAADMSALPVAAATLEAMPRDAKGIAIFEIAEEADRQDIDMPDGIEAHWLVHSDPHMASTTQIDWITGMDWPAGRVQTCIAGESGVIKALRGFLANDKALPRSDVYISGYWKIGLVEDEHQAMKRAEA